MSGRRLIKSVDKALTILEVLAECGDGITLTDLAKRTEININTAKGLLNTLLERGYAKQSSARGRYFLGGSVLLLANHLETEIAFRRITTEVMMEVHRKSGGEAVFCSLVSGYRLVPLSQIEGEHVLTVREMNRYTASLFYAMAQGKIFLANLRQEELDYFIEEHEFEQLGPKAISDKDTLLQELDKIRKTNLALSVDETGPGLAGVAAGIHNREGSLVATLAFGLPTLRMTDERITLLSSLISNAADSISRTLLNGSNELDS